MIDGPAEGIPPHVPCSSQALMSRDLLSLHKDSYLPLFELQEYGPLSNFSVIF